MTPVEFGEALGWPRLFRKGKRGTQVSIGHHGTQVRVTHRLSAEESWVPCDQIGLGFVRAFDTDRPAA